VWLPTSTSGVHRGYLDHHTPAADQEAPAAPQGDRPTGSRGGRTRLTLIPLSLYFSNGNVKVELGSPAASGLRQAPGPGQARRGQGSGPSLETATVTGRRIVSPPASERGGHPRRGASSRLGHARRIRPGPGRARPRRQRPLAGQRNLPPETRQLPPETHPAHSRRPRARSAVQNGANPSAPPTTGRTLQLPSPLPPTRPLRPPQTRRSRGTRPVRAAPGGSRPARHVAPSPGRPGRRPRPRPGERNAPASRRPRSWSSVSWSSAWPSASARNSRRTHRAVVPARLATAAVRRRGRADDGPADTVATGLRSRSPSSTRRRSSVHEIRCPARQHAKASFTATVDLAQQDACGPIRATSAYAGSATTGRSCGDRASSTRTWVPASAWPS